MKLILFLLGLLFCFTCHAQTLDLNLSTPQPRLGETFSLTISIDTVAANLFNFLSDKFVISNYKDQVNAGSTMAVNLRAKVLGHNEIGPMELKINNKSYRIRKISFDVVDSLPPVNQGLWIRTMPLDDSTSYIIIEQRIPASTHVTHDSPNSMSSTTKIDDDAKEIEMIQDADKINFWGSHSQIQTITTGATELSFEYFFALYKIRRKKNGTPVIITRKDFNNVPGYYQFKTILIN